MTVDSGRDAAEALVPRGTLQRLDRYVDLLTQEAARQNLIAASTVETIWTRHILDSLQLMRLATAPGAWIDIGSGAGLPGLVIALASERPVMLIEPRRLRAAFLTDAACMLGVESHVTVCAERCEAVSTAIPAAVISARAVATLPKLFTMAAHLADQRTQWLLPKGRGAADEVAAARLSWQGSFRLVPSLTDPQAMIVDAREVRRKGQQ